MFGSSARKRRGATTSPAAARQRRRRSASSRTGRTRGSRRIGTRPRRRSLIARLFRLGRQLTVAGAIAVAGLYLYIGFTVSIPDRGTGVANQISVRIVDHAGRFIAERGQNRRYVPIDRMPVHLVDAVLATEDRRFYSHFGVDPAGLARAMWTNLRRGKVVEGGSTITQQLAKNLFLGAERTMSRKVVELALAFWLELRLSKSEILETYLNRAYFGSGAYGVEAAAQRYFGKSIDAATLAEAAILAGLLKAPSVYSPDNDPVIAHMRAAEVLSRMVDAGYITASERARAINQDLKLVDKRHRLNAGYAADWIYEEVRQRLGRTTGEIVVETTLDLDLQLAAEASVSSVMAAEGKGRGAHQAALVVMSPEGEVRALVGGSNYAKSQYNRATRSLRQPGSAFKPFVFLAALENGYLPTTLMTDEQVRIDGWQAKNYKNEYRGVVTLADAFARSVNTVAVKLYSELGGSSVIAIARRFGITSPLANTAALSLGTSEVNLLELTAAYAVFANGGSAVRPTVIRRISDASGRVLFVAERPDGKIIVESSAVAQMNGLFAAVIDSGTGKVAALAGRQAGGKTGTTQESRDAWFVGFTRQLVAGVWVGNDDGTPMKNVSGGSLPARIWHLVMTRAHKGLAAEPLVGAAAGTADFALVDGNEPALLFP